MADKSEDIKESIMVGVVVVAIICGVGIFAWQIYAWLKFGDWISIPLSTGLEIIGFDLTSIYHPPDWFGVMKIIRWFLDWPLSLCLPIIAALVIGIPTAIVVAIVSDIKEHFESKKPIRK